MSDFTHIGPEGDARMVDVGEKRVTRRVAIARGRVRAEPATLDAIEARAAAKGDVLAVAQLAGIMGAKKTAELIPLCHPLPLSAVDLRLWVEGDAIEIEAACRTEGKTGVEMEALTAVATAALTVYDMAKASDKAMVIEAIRLERKEGGKSGDWRRPE